MINCKHWIDIGMPDGGACALYNKTCSHGVCRNCKAIEPPTLTQRVLRSIRLGSKIKAVTSAAGIKQCGKCKQRQAVMDGYSKKYQANEKDI